MNDYYYKMIQEYITKHEQTIIHRKNRFIMGEKKKKKWWAELHCYFSRGEGAGPYKGKAYP